MFFYRFKAKIYDANKAEQTALDLRKALRLNSQDWKIWEENIQHHLEKNDFDEAYLLSKKAYKKFPENYNIGLGYAKSLLNTGRFAKVLTVLTDIKVLPFEHASESREIYE